MLVYFLAVYLLTFSLSRFRVYFLLFFIHIYLEHGERYSYTKAKAGAKSTDTHVVRSVTRLLSPASCILRPTPFALRPSSFMLWTLPAAPLAQTQPPLVKGKNLLCLIIIFLLTIRDAYAKKDKCSICIYKYIDVYLYMSRLSEDPCIHKEILCNRLPSAFCYFIIFDCFVLLCSVRYCCCCCSCFCSYCYCCFCCCDYFYNAASLSSWHCAFVCPSFLLSLSPCFCLFFAHPPTHIAPAFDRTWPH